MLGDREKMSTQIDDHWVSMASSGNRVMEKPGQTDPLLQQQQAAALKCPRCESSNTKFCYYNNYSLSQPRHFCKACKRYWTRGGTLRNVPVGGGCRKNKRVKRPTSTSSAIDTAYTSANSPPSSSNANSQVPHIDIASTSNHINSLFYGLPSNSNLFNSRVSNSSGYDLQPQLNANALGLGFEATADQNGYRNGFSSNNTLLYGSIFGSSSTCTPTTAVMASLLSSTLLQQKFINGGGTGNTFLGLEEVQMEGNNKSEAAGLVGSSKQVKLVELGQNNRLEWNTDGNDQIIQMEHVGLSDPNSLYWNTTAAAMGGAGANWNHDQQPNIGPNYSVTSLI